MMLIHKICMAFRGLGSFRNVDIVIREIAAMLLYMENRKYQLSEIKEKRSKYFPDGHNTTIVKSPVETVVMKLSRTSNFIGCR